MPAFLSGFREQQAAYVGIYTIALLGLNVLTGYTGQISLGHGAFMAVGGYTTAILMTDHGVRDLWTIPLAAVVAGGAGFLFGIPALRLSGLYLALATFAIAVATPAAIKKFEHFTGGGSGKNLFGKPELTGSLGPVHVLGHPLSFYNWLYYLVWTIALVGYVVVWLFLRGRIGRALRAVRDSETRGGVVGRQPRPLQDARVRRQRRLRRRRRLPVRDRDQLRQPGHVPGQPLDLPARRRRRRRARARFRA